MTCRRALVHASAALLLAGAAYGLLGAWQARAGLQKQEQIEEA